MTLKIAKLLQLWLWLENEWQIPSRPNCQPPLEQGRLTADWAPMREQRLFDTRPPPLFPLSKTTFSLLTGGRWLNFTKKLFPKSRQRGETWEEKTRFLKIDLCTLGTSSTLLCFNTRWLEGLVPLVRLSGNSELINSLTRDVLCISGSKPKWCPG